MNWTTKLCWMSPCLLVLAILSSSPVLAQQAPGGADTVLPPPADEPTQAPVLTQPTPVPNRGPFLVAPSPSDGAAAAPDPAWDVENWLSWARQNLFGDKEIDIMQPHLKSALVGPAVFPGGVQETVSPPTTQLRWTTAGRIECGFFLPQNCGLFSFTYRFFADDGQQIASALDGTPYALRTRLDLNQIAFDYGTMPYSFAPRWFVSGRLGMAAGFVYFDNVAQSAPQTQDASNYYYGAGPHLRTDVWREFNLVPGLSLFAQPDLMVLVGRVQQHFRESNTLGDVTIAGSSFVRRTQTAPVFTVRTGLSYTPPSLSRWSFLLGYEFEDWWNVGNVPGTASRGEFFTNGVFIRAIGSF
jgi:hypothetical protein